MTELPFDLAHVGVGLCLGCRARHQAGDVPVFDHQVLELVDQFACHLMGGVLVQVGDASVQAVDVALGFPPAAGVRSAAGLGTLPAGELLLGGVVGFGIFPGLVLGIHGVWVEAGVSAAFEDAGVRLGLLDWWLPVVDGE